MSGHPTVLGSTCSTRFEPLRELFAAKLESGEDLGGLPRRVQLLGFRPHTEQWTLRMACSSGDSMSARN